MSGGAKFVMILGAVIFVVGFLMQFIKLGRLPGDIVIKKDNMSFYFPVMTSVLISIVLSAIFYLVSRFK